MILWHIDISHLRESPETHHTATFSSLCQHGMHLLDKLNKLYTTRCQEGGGFQGHLVQDQKKTFNLQEQASQPLWLLYVKQLLAWKKHCCTTECSWSKKANNCSILKCTKAMTEANPSLAVDHTKGWEITSTTSWLNKETISRIVDAVRSPPASENAMAADPLQHYKHWYFTQMCRLLQQKCTNRD